MKVAETILINLTVLVVALVILDVIVGTVFDVSIKSRDVDFRYVELREHKPNSTINRRPTPDYLKGTTNLRDTTFRMSIDGDGFIKGKEDQDGQVDILFLGGSTTECIFVSEELRFPYLVGQYLNHGDKSSLRTLNAGRSGNNSWHSMVQFMAKGLPYKPRFAVLMHNINDLTGLTKGVSYWDAPTSRKIVKRYKRSAKQGRIGGFLLATKNLLFPNLYKLVVGGVKNSQTQEIDEWANYRNRDVSAENRFETAKINFRQSLQTFIAISKIWGTTPILMTQANKHDPDNLDEQVQSNYYSYKQELAYPQFVELYLEFNDVIRAVAQEEGVLLIDLERGVPKKSDFIYDSVHLNDQGSILVASIIAESLAQEFPDDFSLNK